MADFTDFVVGGHFKGDDLAFHTDDGGFCPDLQTYGGGGGMLNVQHGAHGGLGFLQGFRDGLAGGTLHQGHHTGGCVDQQIAGTNFFCGVRALHIGKCLTLHANGNFHNYHNLST